MEPLPLLHLTPQNLYFDEKYSDDEDEEYSDDEDEEYSDDEDAAHRALKAQFGH